MHWLADKGLYVGVEAISPAPEGEPNFGHMACAERGITHMEGLMNLDQLIDKDRFQFIGFPLKIKVVLEVLFELWPLSSSKSYGSF